MQKVFVHAAVSTLLSILVSLAICWAALTALGGRMDAFAIAMCIVCPLAVAFPASAYTYNQKRLIAEAHEALAAAHRDLTVMHAELTEQARRDDLTGLLNRSAFIAAVDETRAGENRGSLLLIDADNFKQINDTYGHLMGDKALREIAEAIRIAVGNTGAKGRVGGEEFGVFLRNADIARARDVAEELRKGVERLPFRPEGYESVRLTVSIGVAEAQTGANFSEIMGAADKRLYEAKRQGRNMVVVETPFIAA